MPLRFLADENFDGRVNAALVVRGVDVVRAQDVGLSGADDPSLLSWAAVEGRVVLTHDRKTMPDFAFDRVAAGEAMPGVIVVSTTGSIQVVVDTLLLFDGASLPGEYEGQIVNIP